MPTKAVRKKDLATKSKKHPGRIRKIMREDPELGLFNRELSWLDFNERVLSLAAQPNIPLLERVKFLSIFSANLDEFFMVRVAGLKEQHRVGTKETTAEGETPDQQLDAISKRTRELIAQQSKLWLNSLQPELAKEGIELVLRNQLTTSDKRYLKQYFMTQVMPVLTPMGVDPAHPFPHLQNRVINLCVVLRAPDAPDSQKLYAFVEVPQILPRFIPMRKSKTRPRFALLSDAIALHLDKLFGGAEILDSYPMRVTRDSDLEIDEDDAEDLLKVIQAELRERQWGNAVRLEISQRAPEEVLRYLQDAIEIDRRDIFPIEGPLNFADYINLPKFVEFPQLRYPPFTPQIRPEWRDPEQIFNLIAEQDRLVHHPYESFSTVMDFVEAAATDPAVLALKLTLYRTTAESPIMRSLIKAAANGKQVVVLVELKARFDEANNIQWAQRLEHGGVHVVYGIVGLKTHCKACLVVRREDKHLRRYCHLATGNYNPVTANLYTDLGLFTADPTICEDVANLFNMLTGFAHQVDWQVIVPSPNNMDDKLLKLIRQETQTARKGGEARICCKMNSLVHPPLIQALYEASVAGVKIDLVVRGICCLRPGVPGMSDNIRVSSLVGRFLEHSRIFSFHQKGDPVVYLSSADWMQRNFFSRIEVMFPILNVKLRDYILNELLPLILDDKANAWELQSVGTWKRKSSPAGTGLDSQYEFCKNIERAANAVRPA